MNPAAPSLATLLQRPDLWRGAGPARTTAAAVPSGYAALDAVLPGGGWPPGALTELLPHGHGCGELSLLLPALAALAPGAGNIALVAPPWPPHAPAWQAVGLARLLVIDAAPHEAAWAGEQLLASGALAALLAWLPQADNRALRRLQLAASGRRSLAFVFRPPAAAADASPAPLRLALAAGEGTLSVRVLKRRGPPLAEPLPLAVSRPARHGRAAAAQAPPAQAPTHAPARTPALP